MVNRYSPNAEITIGWEGSPSKFVIYYRSLVPITGLQIDIVGNIEITNVIDGDVLNYFDCNACGVTYFENGHDGDSIIGTSDINRFLYLDFTGGSIPASTSGEIVFSTPWEKLIISEYILKDDYNGVCFSPDQETHGTTVLTGIGDFNAIETNWMNTCGGNCPNIGDTNCDGTWNVLDIVTLANCILNNICPSLECGCAADLNGDGSYNVLDIVVLANCILSNNCHDLGKSVNVSPHRYKPPKGMDVSFHRDIIRQILQSGKDLTKIMDILSHPEIKKITDKLN